MRTLPVRMRLAVWYLASFFAAFVLFGAGMFYAMNAAIQEDFDRDLKMRLSGVANFLEQQSRRTVPEIRHELQEQTALKPGGELLQIRDGEGIWLFQSDSMRHLGIRMRPLPGSVKPLFETVSAQGIPFRLVTGAKTIAGKTYTFQLAQSLEESSELIRHFVWILIGTIPFVLLSAAAIGYWMARRALQPVIAITEDARSISARDISKRLPVPPAQDELRNLSTTLNAMMDRLEAAFKRITQFTADASHELRTPVALIRTTAELAITDDLPPETKQALSSILEESVRTTLLLEDLLVLARADSNVRPRKENVDLADCARVAVSQLRVLAQAKQITLRFALPEDHCMISGNPEALRRLFLILIDNALKYTPPGGEISVEFSREQETAVVQVRDTGIGIAPEDLPHIFERFYRADKARERESGGAGLGLSIARWIADVHHATIEVSSRLEHGTTVVVRFPIPPDIRHLPAALNYHAAGTSSNR